MTSALSCCRSSSPASFVFVSVTFDLQRILDAFFLPEQFSIDSFADL